MSSTRIPAKTDLAQALATDYPWAARLVLDDDTEVFAEHPEIPSRSYAVYRVVNYHPDHPRSLYVAYAPNAPALILTGQPEQFAALRQAAGISIESQDAALDWARAYLVLTRTTDDLFYFVSSIDDVQTLAASIPAEAAAIDAFRAAYAGTIAPPRVAGDAPPFSVTLCAVREQTLERHLLRVERDGGIVDDLTVMARDLPLVYSA
jgi:hypothetical protein